MSRCYFEEAYKNSIDWDYLRYIIKNGNITAAIFLKDLPEQHWPENCLPLSWTDAGAVVGAPVVAGVHVGAVPPCECDLHPLLSVLPGGRLLPAAAPEPPGLISWNWYFN